MRGFRDKNGGGPGGQNLTLSPFGLCPRGYNPKGESVKSAAILVDIVAPSNKPNTGRGKIDIGGALAKFFFMVFFAVLIAPKKPAPKFSVPVLAEEA